MSFTPTFINISSVAAQTLAPITQIQVNITTPYNQQPAIYNYTLYVVPFNDTFFAVFQDNTTETCQSLSFMTLMNVVVVDLNQCLYVMGPLVNMLVQSPSEDFNATVI
jgi:hypothetical protein